MDHSFNVEAVVHVSFMQFKNKVCAVLETVQERFMLIGGTEAAAEVKHRVIIIQGQCA